MPPDEPQKLVTLDGRVGEGGGQIVRIAMTLAALTGTPLKIENIRGNRPGKRGGGLKAQHASAIRFLAEATAADVTGAEIGSKTMMFRARKSPTELCNRDMHIRSDSAASTLLVFQSIFPFLLFAGDGKGTPITLTIQGGTNVSFSLSYEYLDQVLLPALESFGIHVDRKLEHRGWSHGVLQAGSIKFQFIPLSPGVALKTPTYPTVHGKLSKIDISIIAPSHLRNEMRETLLFEVDLVFPGTPVSIVKMEDSNHRARIYTLLVAHTSSGIRFGRDWLYDRKTKDKEPDQIATEIAQKVVDELDKELRNGGLVDEYLQDQLVIFQALASGRSTLMRDVASNSGAKQIDHTDKPFGDGSMHTTTARWVTGQVLPRTKWFSNGTVCEGVGWRSTQSTYEPV